MARTFFIAAVFSAVVVPIAAQAPVSADSFEVASVKPGDPSFQGVSINSGPDRLSVTNATLKFLIEYAWRVQDFQIYGAPGWAKSELFSIEAKTGGISPGQKTSTEHLATMLRHLLEERFSLQLHQETRELPAYALVVAKSGPRLAPASAGPVGTTSGPGMLRLTRQSTGALVESLASQVGRPVLDRTGIAGVFDMTLKWAPETTSPDAAGPSLFTSIQEELGLKLEPVKAPVAVLVIDHAERPSAN